MPKNIKRQWMIWAVLLLLLSAGVAVPRLWPLLFPSHYVSDLYRHYEHNPHIQATYLRNFPVNDTLFVDVTLLQATDSTGWETLRENFNVLPVPPHIQDAIDRGEDVVAVQLTPKDAPGQPMDTTSLLRNNVMAISRLNHAVCIFETRSRQEIKAVFHSKYQLE